MIAAVRKGKPACEKRPRTQASENGAFCLLRRDQASSISGMSSTSTSLVRAVTRGERWEEFVALYDPLLLSYVRSRRLPPEIDARDIVQEIWAKLWKVMPTFKLDCRRGRFRTWLWQITMNAIIDALRRENRHNKDRVDIDIDPSGSEPDDDWLRKHRRRVLEHVLSQVRDRTQSKTWLCFQQHVLQERRCADVAAELGITANAVCVNSRRVFALVRELCLQYEEGFGDEDDELLSG